MNNEEVKFCQSCGMPLTDECRGTNADGTPNVDYCMYCYKDGAFTGNFSMEDELPHADHPLKQVFIDEVNALGIPGLHIDNLYVLQGSYINQAYPVNGNDVKLLDDAATYWCNQIAKEDGRCYGIACDERHILVSEYGVNGSDPELLIFKKRI